MHYVFHSTQSWSMQGRNELTTKANQTSSTPGPNNYDVKPVYKNHGIASRVNDKRDPFKDINKFPGPGRYQLHSFTQKEAFSKKMGAKINTSPIKPTPGPHEYDQNQSVIKKSSPNFSIASRSKSYEELLLNKKIKQPSPISYNPEQKLFNKICNTFIGTSQRKNLTQTQQTPAPNKYEQLKAKNTKDIHKFGFQKKNLQKKAVKVGPGSYDNPSLFELNLGKRKGSSFGAKLQNNLTSSQVSKSPGPGQYPVSFIHKASAPLFSPGKAQRTIANKKIVPGPGSYKPEQTSINFRSSSCNMFPKAQKPSLYQNQKTPPPYYNNFKKEVLRNAPNFSIPKEGLNKKNDSYKFQDKPSPNQYQPDLVLIKEKVIAHKLANQQRHSFEKNSQIPGPGFYNLRGSEQGPKWHFSKQKRLPESKIGNEKLYDIRKPIADPPKYMNIQNKYSFPKQKVYKN